MAGDYVVDACVLAKVLFSEEGSNAAYEFLYGADSLIAPELVLLEVANVAVKKVRRNEITRVQARDAIAQLPSLLDRIIPTGELLESAVELALTSMASTYDAIYAALAQREGLVLVTADKRFAASLRGVVSTPKVLVLEAA